MLPHTWSWARLAACLVLLLPGGECYNLSGAFCEGARWDEWRDTLWRLANDGPQDFPVVLASPEGKEALAQLHLCPEGVVSAHLCSYAYGSARQRHATLDLLATKVVAHFSAPVLLQRLHLGGWPDFGAAELLRSEVHRHRFPAAAPLLLDATPRFPVPTPPAPPIVQQGWWWSRQEASIAGMLAARAQEGDDSSVDLGMHVLLKRSPMLSHRRGLLLIDIGAFDGQSLMSLGAQVGLNHSILAFEPVAMNRRHIYSHFLEKGLLENLSIWEPDDHSCVGLLPNLLAFQRPCYCRGDGACVLLATVGLSAADHVEQLAPAGAHTSLTMQTHGGAVFGQEEALVSEVRFRVGEPLVRRWVRSVLGLTCVDIHLLKVDVEGSEFSALRGLEALFAEHRVRFLFLEFWPMAIMSWGTDPLGVLNFLSHYGFLCRFIGAHWGPETFEQFLARHMGEAQLTDYHLDSMSFNDLLCEDIYWNDPCGWERAARVQDAHQMRVLFPVAHG